MNDQNQSGGALDDLLRFLKEQAPVVGTKADPLLDTAGGVGGGLLGLLLGKGNPLAGIAGAGAGLLGAKGVQQMGRALPTGDVQYDLGNPAYYMDDPARVGAWMFPVGPAAMKMARTVPGAVQNAAESVGNMGQDIGQVAADTTDPYDRSRLLKYNRAGGR